MALRLVITEAVWAEMAPVVRALKHEAGSPPQLSDRLFIEAVLSPARTGLPWRDLPADFGHGDAVYNRLRRWEARQLWQRLWQHLQQNGWRLATPVCIDSTIMRAQPHAAGARKKTGGKTRRLLVALGADVPPNYTPPAPRHPRGSACS